VNSDSAAVVVGGQVVFDVMTNDFGGNADRRTFVVVDGPRYGTVEQVGNSPNVRYRSTSSPSGNEPYTDTFVYRVCSEVDGSRCGTATVTINVTRP
jgi:hypothetical protein